ncbi:MAG: peptidylprolyl isomerase [Rhizobiaceae bacterium]|nr:MAG: peptidylprolyl isomerase [Rhizobiaceae bacterium]
MTVTVNGVEIIAGADEPAQFAAVRELLRQRAAEIGLLEPAAAEGEGTVEAAIEALLSREVVTPSPEEEECRRYYEGHRREFQSGDLVHARHILFQITPQVNVPQIRARAEQTLNELLAAPDRFAALARELSNCPSGQHGGNLGQIGRGDTVLEFEKAVFKFGASGILRDIVKTRYGFHIVAVDQSIPGKPLPFEVVREQIAERLRMHVEEKAMRQYVSVLAARAKITGVEVNAANSPLVQ